jgi:hypothetical protein
MLCIPEVIRASAPDGTSGALQGHMASSFAASFALAATISALALGCFWHRDRDVHDPPREDRHDDHHDGDHHDEHRE